MAMTRAKSKQITHKLDATGATTVNLHSKLSETVSVFDFMTAAQIADVQAGTALVDVTAAIQDALTYQGAAQIYTTDASGNTIGDAPEVYFPRGRYVVSASLNLATAYARLRGENAILEKAGSFTGTAAIQMAGSAWRLGVYGLQFKDFEEGIYLDSSNLNSGKVEIEKCGFFGITENAIRLDCQSTITEIKDCIWRSCKHELVIETGDVVSIKGGWIQRGLLTDNYDGGIVVGSVSASCKLLIEDTLLVPTTQSVVEPCWIKSYGTVSARRVRVGGESGQHTLVNNYALGTDVTADPKNGVEIDGCDVYVGNDCAIRLFEIPHSIIITNSRGFTGAGVKAIKWSTSVDAGTQTSKIAAISTTANRHTIYLAGNVLEVLPETNLIPLSYMPSQLIQKATGGDLAIIQDFRSAAITAGQNYGRWEQIGRDTSAGASGTRAQIRVVSIGTGGGTETIIANAPNAGSIVDVVKSLSTGFFPAVDNARLLGDSALRWSGVYGAVFYPGNGTAKWTSGTGTPEGVVTAVVGSIYTRTDGGAGTTLYVKESGAGNTGWVAK